MPKYAPGFPFTAFHFRTPYLHANGYSDALVIRAVQVIAVDGDKACCGVRTGGTSAIEVIPVAELASTAKKALAKAAPHLAALLSRPLLPNAAGTTEGAAAINPATGRRAVTDQGASHPGTSQPQPLAGPHHRERFSYANV